MKKNANTPINTLTINHYSGNKDNWSQLIYLILVFIFPMLLAMRESGQIQVIVGQFEFLIYSAIVGSVISLFFYVLLRRISLYKKSNLATRLSLLFLLGLGSCALSAGVMSILNRKYAETTIRIEDVVVVKKGTSDRTRSPNSSKIRLLDVQVSGNRRTIEVGESFWFKVEVGSIIRLKMKKGLLGFYFVFACDDIE